MTTDAKQIAPALSAEEWANVLRPNEARGFPEDGEPYEDRRAAAKSFGSWKMDTGHFPQALAAANAALPDDSPYKITRDDVGRLRDIAVGLESATDIPGAMGSGRTLHTLADKLAALLPPEG